MSMNLAPIKDIVIAVVGNPSFFIPTALPESKIKQVSDLIKEVEKTTE